MMTESRSTIHTTEFNITNDIRAGLNWKSCRSDIENTLKSGQRITFITSEGNTGYSPRKFLRTNFNDIQAVKDLVNNPDLIFTKDQVQLEAGNQGYFVVSKKHINEILGIPKGMYHAELEHFNEQTRLEAERAAKEEEQAAKEEYQALIGQANRLAELQERFGSAT